MSLGPVPNAIEPVSVSTRFARSAGSTGVELVSACVGVLRCFQATTLPSRASASQTPTITGKVGSPRLRQATPLLPPSRCGMGDPIGEHSFAHQIARGEPTRSQKGAEPGRAGAFRDLDKAACGLSYSNEQNTSQHNLGILHSND